MVVVLVAAGLLLGVRVLLGTAQRAQCGAPGGAALILSVQALGAAPSVTECLGLGLTAPTAPAGAGTPDADPAPSPPAPEPPLPHGFDPDAAPPTTSAPPDCRRQEQAVQRAEQEVRRLEDAYYAAQDRQDEAAVDRILAQQATADDAYQRVVEAVVACESGTGKEATP
jgi:hypothetical protein